jgi:hypothetical protein
VSFSLRNNSNANLYLGGCVGESCSSAVDPGVTISNYTSVYYAYTQIVFNTSFFIKERAGRLAC